jgi:putative tributyrin esterase
MRHDQGLRSNQRLIFVPADREAKVEIPMHTSILDFVTRAKTKLLFILLMPCLVFVTPAHAQGKKRVNPQHAPSKASRAGFKDVSFHSPALGRKMRYRIIVPANYEGTMRRFPTLYLLHGLFGDYENWETRTNLEHYVEKLKWIIVMPDADDSWYTNSATVPGDKFEDYITRDLITEIDARYRTIRSRHSRAIAGLSMGGYGALKFAMNNPDSFIFAGSLSGALNAPLDLEDTTPSFRKGLEKAFGPPGDPARSRNDLFTLLNSSDPARLPYAYLECGTSDGFLQTNREFAAKLGAHKVVYEYHETPGDHSWEFWDAALSRMLHALERVLKSKV